MCEWCARHGLGFEVCVCDRRSLYLCLDLYPLRLSLSLSLLLSLIQPLIFSHEDPPSLYKHNTHTHTHTHTP